MIFIVLREEISTKYTWDSSEAGLAMKLKVFYFISLSDSLASKQHKTLKIKIKVEIHKVLYDWKKIFLIKILSHKKYNQLSLNQTCVCGK